MAQGTLVRIRIPKPAHGAPCNSCGACCLAQLCILGQAVFGRREAPPCPALEHIPDGRKVCGLLASPATYFPVRSMILGEDAIRDAVSVIIGGGTEATGCDCHAVGEPYNQAFIDALDARPGIEDRQLAAAKVLFGEEALKSAKDAREGVPATSLPPHS